MYSILHSIKQSMAQRYYKIIVQVHQQRALLPFNSGHLKAGHPSTTCRIFHILPYFKILPDTLINSYLSLRKSKSSFPKQNKNCYKRRDNNVITATFGLFLRSLSGSGGVFNQDSRSKISVFS